MFNNKALIKKCTEIWKVLLKTQISTDLPKKFSLNFFYSNLVKNVTRLK